MTDQMGNDHFEEGCKIRFSWMLASIEFFVYLRQNHMIFERKLDEALDFMLTYLINVGLLPEKGLLPHFSICISYIISSSF